jgi:uncharacterized membrane protein YjdF
MFKILKILIRMVFSMFNKNSGLVKVWVSVILVGTYTYEQVPNLSNLKTVVGEVLNEIGYSTESTSA